MSNGKDRQQCASSNFLVSILMQTRKYIKTSSQNLFATASWFHYLLAGCHPFNDSNGRTCKLVPSIPLVLVGYPPSWAPTRMQGLTSRDKGVPTSQICRITWQMRCVVGILALFIVRGVFGQTRKTVSNKPRVNDLAWT